MNSKDKTRQKLVGSMRKTKAAAGVGEDETEKKAPQAAPARPKPQSPAPKRIEASSEPGPDPYQRGPRIWPD